MNKTEAVSTRAVLCALFAILTGLLAQIEIPLPYVPISGQTLAVGLTATVLGSRLSVLSMLIYVALGVVGLPVFAGFKGGAMVLAGPTGGYIFGFILAAYIIGFMLEKTGFSIGRAFAANIIGMIIILALGMTHLKFVMELTWASALATGVYPFLFTGLIKAFLAGWIGIIIRKRFKLKGLL